MYNEELKKRFLASYSNEGTRKQYKEALKKISKEEELHKLDVFNFNYEQLESALNKCIHAKTMKGVGKLASPIKRYILWAKKENISNIYFEDKQILFEVEALRTHIVDVQGTVFREELYAYCERLVNPVDQVILVLPLEGILGKELCEMTNLKFTDINFRTGKVKIGNTREIIIEDRRSLDILKACQKQDTYIVANGMETNKRREFKLENTPYVIRKMIRGNNSMGSNDVVSANYILSKVVRFFKGTKKPFANEIEEEPFLSDGKYLNPTNLFYSGFFDYCMKLEKRYGTLDIETIKEACKRYGIDLEYRYVYKSNYEYWKKIKDINNFEEDFSEFFEEARFQYQVEKEKMPASIIMIDKPKEVVQKSNKNGTSYERDPATSKRAIVYANFFCENNSNHNDFISRITNKNYVEAHHLIPMEYQDEFKNTSIDVEANIVSLCVTCHAKLHHASFSSIRSMLEKLYDERIKRLNDCGLNISKSDFLNFYKRKSLKDE